MHRESCVNNRSGDIILLDRYIIFPEFLYRVYLRVFAVQLFDTFGSRFEARARRASLPVRFPSA